ncbi:Protein RMD5-like [Vitis vinifera]|uniref:Protein RMD5-like n=1 Tax=Vitis vinifera TaxID=29760 RepID=A0A438FBG8_VITVI|nr:Protein RMD5-like [Vitis vinifera]
MINPLLVCGDDLCCLDDIHWKGLFDNCDCFTSEAREPEAAALKPPFLEMHLILAAITARNLEPALNWASTNGDKLEQNGSDLELKLHRLQFLEILQKESRDKALKYARITLPLLLVTIWLKVKANGLSAMDWNWGLGIASASEDGECDGREEAGVDIYEAVASAS